MKTRTLITNTVAITGLALGLTGCGKALTVGDAVETPPPNAVFSTPPAPTETPEPPVYNHNGPWPSNYKPSPDEELLAEAWKNLPRKTTANLCDVWDANKDAYWILWQNELPQSSLTEDQVNYFMHLTCHN